MQANIWKLVAVGKGNIVISLEGEQMHKPVIETEERLIQHFKTLSHGDSNSNLFSDIKTNGHLNIHSGAINCV